jgi:hypothetical protein
VEITTTLAEQLQVLCGAPAGHRLTAGLSRLGAEVAGAVPSCLAVSIVPAGLGAEISVRTPVRAADPTPVRASLAVPLSAAEPWDVLILRAGAAGAFLLLADDLGGLLGPGYPPIEVDHHLSAPGPTGESAATALADLGAVNQGIGALIDQGWPPGPARGELHRRADEADLSLGAASRVLLGSLAPRAGSTGP